MGFDTETTRIIEVEDPNRAPAPQEPERAPEREPQREREPAKQPAKA